MPPMNRQESLPGISVSQDGTVEFCLTEEEAREADLALSAFTGHLVHPEAAERIRNGTIAVALSRYAKNLVRDHCLLVEQEEFERRWPEIRTALFKAIAAEWKAHMLYPLPVFLYHRASFLEMLGAIEEARQIFTEFLTSQPEFKPDSIDEALIRYEETDIERALSAARKGT
jgi:hypothetical protein